VVPSLFADPNRVTLGKTNGIGFECTREVTVRISEPNGVTLGKTKGTGTSLRSGASPLCLAQSENETALARARESLEPETNPNRDRSPGVPKIPVESTLTVLPIR
jgi:hypothetical protein